MLTLMLAQNQPSMMPFGMVQLLIMLIIDLLIIIGGWKLFTKAGQPGWGIIIPIYNVYLVCKIVGRSGWWVLLIFIPFVSIVVLVVLALDLAKSFGQGVGMGIGIAILPFIFIPVLGFGDAQYQGPSAP